MAAASSVRRAPFGRFTLGRGAALLLMAALTVITLYPLAWLVLSSLKTAYEMFDGAGDCP